MRVDRVLDIQDMKPARTAESRPGAEPLESFGDMLKQALNRVSDAQTNAEVETQRFLVGDAEDLHTVTLAVAEARTMLQLAVQVRDRVVEAYREVRQIQM
jgi:flagellar hook-basal body complex protein FliE